jgi:prepilin-type N-terminal cleavage/methylation domain-containing protein
MSISFHQTYQKQSGVSVVELLVVLAVISVICGFALMQRGSVDDQVKRQNAAHELKVAFERARFDSVKRRPANSGEMAMVTVTPSSFTLRTYTNEANGTAVPHDQSTTLPSGIVIGRYDGSALTTLDVTFDMRGETGMGSTTQFFICNVSCTGQRTNLNANLLIVTPTGTVNLLPGSANIPSFGLPSVSPVPANANINPDAVL